MAYSTSESGRSEIVVVPFPNTGDAKWPVSIDGGVEPWWSRDGREIFYRNSKQELVSARVEAEATFTVGTTTALFADGDYLRIGLRQQYDVTADGKRFLMIRPVGAGRERRVVLVRNAFGSLDAGAAK